MTELVKFEAIHSALMEARTVDEVKDIRDKAEALRIYVRQQGQSLEMQNACAEIKIRAERRAGELLAEMPKNGGGNPNLLHDATGLPPSYKELGIERTQSHRWQTIARLPEPIFEQHITQTKSNKKELTSASMLMLAKRLKAPEPAATPVYPQDKCPSLFVGKAENTPIPSNSVDIIITSPPYNLGKSNWAMGGEGRTPRENGIGYDLHDDHRPELEYQNWQIQCLEEMYRVAKPGASLFYNHKVRIKDGKAIHPMAWIGREDNPWTLRQEIIWDRTSTHNHNPTLFWPEDERIYWLVKGSKPNLYADNIAQSTIWRFHGPIPNAKDHPAPFSPELPRRCLRAIGGQKLTVLDPFAGSCTTLKVALEEFGFEAIGVDISRTYLDEARKANGWNNGS